MVELLTVDRLDEGTAASLVAQLSAQTDACAHVEQGRFCRVEVESDGHSLNEVLRILEEWTTAARRCATRVRLNGVGYILECVSHDRAEATEVSESWGGGDHPPSTHHAKRPTSEISRERTRSTRPPGST